jgi:hypothetical protein
MTICMLLTLDISIYLFKYLPYLFKYLDYKKVKQSSDDDIMYTDDDLLVDVQRISLPHWTKDDNVSL